MKKKSKLGDFRSSLAGDDLDEAELFRRAMADVVPLPGRGSGELVSKKGAESGKRAAPTPESPEPRPQDAGGQPRRRLLRKLRRGGFKVQDDLDLHGLTRDEARRELEIFLRESVGRGLRCVLIVHGRGWNSPNRESVLREKVPEWLADSRLVQAFAPALAGDGGSGALYVLLRRGVKREGGPKGSAVGGRD